MSEIVDKLPTENYSPSHPRRQISASNEPAAINRIHIEGEDLKRLRAIDRHPKVLKWMTGGISSDEELIEWARDEMLFAIRGKKSGPHQHAGEVIGFVNTYTLGQALKNRLRENGLIDSNQAKLPIYEIAYAIHPDARYQRGLVSSAVRLVTAQIGAMQNEVDFYNNKPNLRTIHPQAIFIAFLDPNNTESIAVLQRAGFRKKSSQVKYHGNSKKADEVYILDWKIHGKLLKPKSATPIAPEAPGL